MIKVIAGDWAPIYMFGEKTKYIIHKHTGEVINTNTGKTITHSIDKDGYHKVHLYHKGKDKNFRINRLVYLSFYGNDEFNDDITEVNHKNLNKDDNSLYNLEACSRLYNIQHAVKYGARKKYRGVNSVLNKHPEKTIHDILKLLESGKTAVEISKMLHVPLTNISDIKRGRTWCHISKDYKLPKYIKHKSTELVINIIKDIIVGESNIDIANKYGVDHKYVSLIRNKKRHRKLYNEIKDKMCIKESSTTIENEDDYYKIKINL